jgi:hypothetical protein
MPQVFESAVIAAPAERVWALIGDFNSMPDWQPDIVASEIENGVSGKTVGCVRRATQHDGTQIRGILVEHSDREHSYTYAVLTAPIPIFDYVGRLSLRPVTATGHTYIEWSCRFEAPPDVSAEAATFLADVFRRSFANIEKILSA